MVHLYENIRTSNCFVDTTFWQKVRLWAKCLGLRESHLDQLCGLRQTAVSRAIPLTNFIAFDSVFWNVLRVENISLTTLILLSNLLPLQLYCPGWYQNFPFLPSPHRVRPYLFVLWRIDALEVTIATQLSNSTPITKSSQTILCATLYRLWTPQLV
jgi:hypothetical protein